MFCDNCTKPRHAVLVTEAHFLPDKIFYIKKSLALFFFL